MRTIGNPGNYIWWLVQTGLMLVLAMGTLPAQSAGSKPAPANGAPHSSELAKRQQEDDLLGGWRDPTTNLVWTKQDNGVPVKAHEAEKYCKELRSGGHADWRLPTIKELESIQDMAADVDGFNVRGGIRLSCHCVMSSNHRLTTGSHITLALEFAGTQEGDMLVASGQTWDAAWSYSRCTVLCVRAAESDAAKK
jgi:Protein of unknown function (DUF1566)